MYVFPTCAAGRVARNSPNLRMYLAPVGTAAPDCIIPELFGDDVVETCAITTTIEPRPWICKFIKVGKSKL